MPEQGHLLLREPQQSTLADAIKSLKQGVSRRLIGGAEHFWQRRYQRLPALGVQRSFVGRPRLCRGLHCLRMTARSGLSRCCPLLSVNGIMERMNGNRWGAAGPPMEAYSRVTDPERFGSLHRVAAELLDRLEREFDADRAEGYGLDPELERGIEPARPSVTLVPRDAGAAPIAVAFSTFPGIVVRLGRWCTSAFPTCGCDACDETAEGEIERLKSMIHNLTAGRFREAIRISADGTPWQEWEFWSGGGRCAKSRLDPDRARQLVAAGDRSLYEWGPWPKRK
jgi:Family of unknown function (DUF6226)